MDKKFVIKTALFLLLFISSALVIFKFREPIKRLLQVASTGKSIILQTDVPKTTLSWQNRESLDNILLKLQIFDEGVRDLKTSKIEKINSIKVIYTPEVQTTLTNVTEDNKIISGGSYELSNGLLTIKIYVDSSFVPNGDTNTIFNQEFIQFLVALSTTSQTRTSGQAGSTLVEERMEYFYSILKEHFGNNEPYPIKII